MITVTFTAESVPAIIGQMLIFIGETRPQSYPTLTPKRPRGRPPKASALDPEAVLGAIKDAVEERFPLVEEEPIEAPPIEVVGEEEADEVSEVEAPPSDAIANEKIKQEVIAQLSDLFTAGKVKTLRHILDTYGRGAKSFPEIDASAFPAIKEALNRGEAA